MPLAFVLINTEEFDPQMLKALRSIKGVEEAYPLYGVYDIIVKTKADTMEEVKKTHDRIRKLERVRQTLTMVATEK